MSNAVVVVTVREESSRLPGKAFKSIAGRMAIEHIVHRATQAGLPVVIATPFDLEKYSWLKSWWVGVSHYMGEDDSPLHRLAAIARKSGADWIVRVTHDDLLIDPREMKVLLAHAADAPQDLGYIISDGIVEGAGVEFIHRDNLLAAAEARKEPTEYVSYFVKGAQPRPGVLRVPARPSVQRAYRLTMDYKEDAALLDHVLSRLGPDAPLEEIVDYLDRKPTLLNWNRLPLISFYTCAHNAARWIGEAMASVVYNGLQDFEYVVVDDASEDDTAAIAASFLRDKRVRLISNPKNLGLASSSNVALRACRGKYVMRIDADDRLTPEFLHGMTQMMTLANGGARAIYPAFSTLDERGRLLEPWNDPAKDHHIGGALLEKKLLDEIRFRDGLRHFDGLELYTRMVAAGARIEHVNAVTWQYRQHEKSMSRSEPESRATIKTNILKGKV